MDKHLLKNPLILAILTIVMSYLVGWVEYAIFFSFRDFYLDTALMVIGGILTATIVGCIYAGLFKEIMLKKTRIIVAVIYVIFQMFAILVVSAFFVFIPALVSGLSGALSGLGMAVLILIPELVYALLIYWVLGLSGKIYLKLKKIH
ncbi:hypothetical protein GOV06_03085 [Candidatus Woesearchaeota archaeon]|nr:hypothetical protein [Candidatus Woesearchaeota archaeon]